MAVRVETANLDAMIAGAWLRHKRNKKRYCFRLFLMLLMIGGDKV